MSNTVRGFVDRENKSSQIIPHSRFENFNNDFVHIINYFGKIGTMRKLTKLTIDQTYRTSKIGITRLILKLEVPIQRTITFQLTELQHKNVASLTKT